ncbi:MAG: Re/Si-specific NAD(P)(+) transhydrogenase subunit alpha [archaeon]|nr:Re/Si-specific NAD(P)(+) transhydrogenase subunit alpha [archaeon]
MIIGVPKEIVLSEKRVSVIPEAISKFAGAQVIVESGAGEGAGFTDMMYSSKSASIVLDAETLYSRSDIVLKVQPPTKDEVGLLKEGSTLISFLYPLANLETVSQLVRRKITSFAMDLMPRISRAQSMDALSSQATISGYKAVLLAADSLPKLFPMMMTAAGTISPAHVFVIGAGVAGLQAIAVAHRLGAVVEAYDVRPVVKEQIESLGAKFVQLPVSAQDAQTSGGYAKAQSEDFYRKQQDLLSEHTKSADVVITTALVPGQRAPTLVSEEAVKGMRAASVIVDLAAEQGGNCALTEPGKTVIKYGITIHGLLNLPSLMAPQASQLYSRNITTFLFAMLKEGKLNVDLNDELIRGPLVTQNGLVMHDQTKKALEALAAVNS